LGPALAAAAGLAPSVAALIDGLQHLQVFQAQLLALATHVEGHEVAKVLQRDLAAQLQLEGGGTAAIGSRLLTHLQGRRFLDG
jgi:pseudouridine-5'-phosphate glycosidase